MSEDLDTTFTDITTTVVPPLEIFNAAYVGDSFYSFLQLPPITAKERVASVHRGIGAKVESTMCKCYKKALNRPSPGKVLREIQRISRNFVCRCINLQYRLDLLQNKLQIRTKERVELLDYGRGLTNYDATVNLLTMYYNYPRE